MSLFKNMPPPLGYDIMEWPWQIQITMMLREKSQAISGGQDWPRTSPSYGDLGGISGTPFTLDYNDPDDTATIAQSLSDWTVDPDSGCSGERFAGYYCSDPDLCDIPNNYYAVLVADITDPQQVVYCSILSNTAFTLTIDAVPIHNAITAGFIDDISDFVEVHIIQQNGGLWWDKRWLNKPNDYESWRGTLADGVVDGDGSTGFLQQFVNDYNPDPYDSPTNPDVNWTANQWVGYDCMTYSADGVLHRLNVTSNDANTLYFGGGSGSFSGGVLSAPLGSWSAWSGSSSSYGSGSGSVSPQSLSGKFILLGDNHGSGSGSGSIGRSTKGDPHRLGGLPFMWYGGAVSDCLSVIPTSLNNIDTTPLAAEFQTWSTPQPPDGDCECTDFTAIDTDVWVSDQTCMCQDWNTCRSPNMFKTIRGWQVAEDGLVGSFIDQTRFSGSSIYLWHIPTIYLDAGVNAWSATVGYVSDTVINVSAAPFDHVQYPIAVQWTILKLDANSFDASADGSGTLAYDGTLTGGGWSSTDDGKTIVLTLGRTREKPLQIGSLYPRTCWVCDTDDGGGAIDPPALTFNDDGTLDTCNGAGIWIKRGPSGAFKDFGDNGKAAEDVPFSQYTSGSDALSGAVVAQMVGNDSNDPFTGNGFLCPDGCDSEPTPANTPYFSRFWRGHYDKLTEDKRTASKKGIITEGGSFYFRDDQQDWWNITNTTGVLRIESGVSTGGSSTTLIDTSKIADDTNPSTCFWAASRFIGFNAPYEGFILEVTGSSSGSGSEWSGTSGSAGGYSIRVPITSVDNTTGTITFEDVGIVVGADATYQIREPMYCLNLWEGTTVRVTRDDGTTIDLLVEQSDDTSIYFAPQSEPLQAGWAYEILEIPWGALLTYTGASGSGSVSGDDYLTVDGWTYFTGSMKPKRATIIRDYGRYHKGDYVGTHLYAEIYSISQRLKKGWGGPSWTDKSSDTAAPDNNYGPGGGAYSTTDFGSALSEAQGDFSWSSQLDGTPPSSNGGCYYDGGWMVNFNGVYAYEKISGYGRIIPATIDFYAFSPKIDNFCFCSLEITGCDPDPVTGEYPPIVYPTCDNCGGYDGESPCVAVEGESVWTGGSIANLAYGMWANVGSADNSGPSAYSPAVGNQNPQLAIDPIALLGYERVTPGLGCGYTVTDQIAIFTYDFQWT